MTTTIDKLKNTIERTVRARDARTEALCDLAAADGDGFTLLRLLGVGFAAVLASADPDTLEHAADAVLARYVALGDNRHVLGEYVDILDAVAASSPFRDPPRGLGVTRRDSPKFVASVQQ